MMKNNSSGGGFFLSLLAILFIGLKLGGVIQWSWIWVLSPIWVPVALVLFILLVVMIGLVARLYIRKYRRNRLYKP